MHKDLSLFSDAQLAAVIEAEAFRHERECIPASEPHAVLLAGQPGAGKTELSTMIMKSFPYGGCAFINGDDYRRLHPNYRQLYKEHGSDSVTMTSKFSSMVTEAMIARLMIIRFAGNTIGETSDECDEFFCFRVLQTIVHCFSTFHDQFDDQGLKQLKRCTGLPCVSRCGTVKTCKRLCKAFRRFVAILQSDIGYPRICL